MEIFYTILIGAAKFLGFMALVLPIATGIVGDTGTRHYDNKLAKFYFVTWPIILLVGIGIAVMILVFYHIGKDGMFKNA
jgi:hypothetical protein